ncbi:RNA recognition motif containing protein [Entamoeba marina]
MSLWKKTQFSVKNVADDDLKSDVLVEAKSITLSNAFPKSKVDDENESDDVEALNDEVEEGDDEEKTFTPKKTKKKLNSTRHIEEADRTVFITNVSVDVKHSEMKKFLSKYGNLISYRFRNTAYSTLDKSKKVNFLKKEFNKKRKTQGVYALYETKDEAKSAAEQIDNTLFLGYHLRADWEVNKDQKKDVKKTIFVGNLPFNIEEEDVRKAFEKQAGNVQRVRVVRDNNTGTGRGIAYVTFKEKEDVQKGLDFVGNKIKGRLVRVSPCYKNYEKIKEKKEQRLLQFIQMKKEKKRVYKERVKSHSGKLQKSKSEKKPRKNQKK